MSIEQDIQQAAEKLRSAQQIAVLTGAGVSKESGIPTFRDAMDGIWAKYDPAELATPQAFKRNPKLVWDWYAWRRSLVSQAQPNPAHVALAQLQHIKPATVIITQNVDDLHEQAGSEDVIHLHGNIARNRCSGDCGEPAPKINSADGDETPPRCPSCGAYLRPDVVWFGESLPSNALFRAAQLAEQCDVMLVVGTSGMVYPAAGLPASARKHGSQIIEVNPVASNISTIAEIHLQAAAGEVLPQVIAEITS